MGSLYLSCSAQPEFIIKALLLAPVLLALVNFELEIAKPLQDFTFTLGVTKRPLLLMPLFGQGRDLLQQEFLVAA